MAKHEGSTSTELLLKFFFANRDDVHVEMRFPRATLIADVKAQLAQHWPSELPPPETLKSIRLICMGRGMLQDAQTLESSKIPAFETHATPVNVSVLRRQLAQAAGEPSR